jgi:hypothetical protein
MLHCAPHPIHNILHVCVCLSRQALLERIQPRTCLLLLLHEFGVCGLVLLVAELQALPDLREMRIHVCAELGEGCWRDGFGRRGLRAAYAGRRGVEYLGRSLRLLLLRLGPARVV